MSTLEQTRTEPGPRDARDRRIRVSVVIPCLNEAETIERCVRAAYGVLDEHRLAGEVIVVDNGSDDGSAGIAARAGAQVVMEPRRGYGSAYLAGFAAARGDYIVMADADLTYDFGDIPRFVEQLDDGADLVMGDRMDNIQPGAMPWLHRYVGNPVLTGILNLFFRTGVSDAHCGMRAFRRDVLPRLDLRTTGMEFASEMVIRASKEDLDIRQFPIEYHPRGGESKLSSFRDGWRHLRFLLVHSPTHLFVIPGRGDGRARRAHLARGSGSSERLRPRLGPARDDRRRAADDRRHAGARARAVRARLRHLLHGRAGPLVRPHARALPPRARPAARAAPSLAGLVLGAVIVGIWIDRGFGQLSEERLAVLAATLLIVGIQIFFSSFLLSILGLRRHRAEWLLVVRAGDRLAPRALERFGQAAALAPDAALLTSDEDRLDRAGRRHDPMLRPGPSPDLMLAVDLVGAAVCLRRDPALAAGGLAGDPPLARYRLALALAGGDGAGHAHLPAIVVHRGDGEDDRALSPDAAAEVVREALAARGEPAARVETLGPRRRRVRRGLAGEPSVEVIVCFRDHPGLLRRCAESLLELTAYERVTVTLVDNASTDPEIAPLLAELGRDARVQAVRDDRPFNFSALNNAAAARSDADVLVFLNNDTQVLEGGWVEELLEEAQRDCVGAVAPLLVYPDVNRVQC